VLWGDVGVVRERLGGKVKKIYTERGIMSISALHPQQLRLFQEAKAGPFVRAVEVLSKEPAKLAEWRREMDELIGKYLHDNALRHEYLLTRAVKI
jgi:hypothetical protein